MVAKNFGTERKFDDAAVRVVPVRQTPHVQISLAYFAPGQTLPIRPVTGDTTVAVHAGKGIIRDGVVRRQVGPGDVISVPPGDDLGIRAAEKVYLEVLVTVVTSDSDTMDAVDSARQRHLFESTEDASPSTN